MFCQLLVFNSNTAKGQNGKKKKKILRLSFLIYYNIFIYYRYVKLYKKIIINNIIKYYNRHLVHCTKKKKKN